MHSALLKLVAKSVYYLCILFTYIFLFATNLFQLEKRLVKFVSLKRLFVPAYFRTLLMRHRQLLHEIDTDPHMHTHNARLIFNIYATEIQDSELEIFIPPYVFVRRIGTYVSARLRMCAGVSSQKVVHAADATCFLFGSVDRFLNIPRRTWNVVRGL